MTEWIEHIDRVILLFINSHHSPALDEFFYAISSRTFWIPFYLIVAYLLLRDVGWKKTLIFLGVTGLAIALADVGSVYLFKETVQRYRPSHNTEIQDLLHYFTTQDGLPYLGGQYGFISSHATNFAVLTVFVGLSIRANYPNMIWWFTAATLLVCYARVYLGVHYPTDVLGGLIWGAFVGYVMYILAGRRAMPFSCR